MKARQIKRKVEEVVGAHRKREGKQRQKKIEVICVSSEGEAVWRGTVNPTEEEKQEEGDENKKKPRNKT